MKNKRPLFVVLLCLLLAGGVVLVLLPCSPMPWQCSKLYWQYRGQEGIEASYVKQYPVDDTTLVDVTLLQATTDSAWEKLCIAFTHYEFSDSSDYINKLVHDTSSVTFWTVSKDDHHVKVIPATANDFDFIALTAKMNSICIFHTKNKEQLRAMMDKMITNILITKQSNLL